MMIGSSKTPPRSVTQLKSVRFVAPLAVLFLAAHCWLAIAGVWGRSVTSDETGHLTAGYAYWKFGDYRLQPENGNLPQRWGALPLLGAEPTLRPDVKPDDWAASRVWNVAQYFLFESGNNTDFILLCARATMLAWSVAAGVLVFGWARTLWGDTAGLGALALFCFSPTTLAHGPLVTSDMCGAACLLSALAGWWAMCRRPTVGRMVLAGGSIGLAMVAKFSAVLLLPAFGILAALSVISLNSPGRATATARLLGGAAGAIAIAVTVVWAFYGFRYQAANGAIPFATFYLPWDMALAAGGFWTELVNVARKIRALPEAFLYGFSFVAFFSAQRGGFLVGNYSSFGWWWFFPFAFLVKSTVGELLVSGLIVWRNLRRVPTIGRQSWRNACSSGWMPLAVFGSIYLVVSLASKLNIGQRHILPLYLILFIFSGVLFSEYVPKWTRVLALIAVLLTGGETLANRFNHLAFFNVFAGGPANGWRLLVDSSLDWGQDVSALAQWVNENKRANEPVYYSCFGTADPEYEGIRGESLSPYYSLGKPRHWMELQPGLYCISATMLQDVYGLEPGPWSNKFEKDFQYLKVAARAHIADKTWGPQIPETGFHPEHPLWLLDRLRFARLCQYLKVRKPEAVINYTQFVYRLTPEEIDIFSNKPYSALATMIETAAERKR